MCNAVIICSPRWKDSLEGAAACCSLPSFASQDYFPGQAGDASPRGEALTESTLSRLLFKALFHFVPFVLCWQAVPGSLLGWHVPSASQRSSSVWADFEFLHSFEMH